MQEGGVFAASILSGNGTSAVGPSQGAPSLSKGVASSSTTQGVSLTSRGGASTSASQGISLPSRGGMSASAFQAASNTPRGGVTTLAFQGAVNPPRQRFHVELKEGETNVVSWKKLLKDAQKLLTPIGSEAPAGANPALEARIAPDRAGSVLTSGGAVQEPLPPPPNRFSSVIEKIERLYKGGDSEEEEGDVSPDDSQYDTEDDFIDDSELNEYFSVEKSKTKHTGFFVNRGKLEKINEVPAPPPTHVPRKRKRRDMKTVVAEKVVEESAKKRVNTGIRLKDAARKSLVIHAADGVGGSSTAQYRVSDQSSVPKLKKRLKPILDARDKSVDQVPTAAVENVSREVLKVAKIEDNKKQSSAKSPMTIVELSDDENDTVEASKKAADNEKRMVDFPKKQASRQQESGPVSVDEKNYNSAFKASADERQAKDSAREMKGALVTSKVKKDQYLNRDFGTREREGSDTTPAPVASSPGRKDASPGKRAGWPKGTVLERAIHDLEKGVAESFPFRGDKEEKRRAIEIAEAQGGKSKRMPRDVKQKLAKVARLAARHGKIPDELIERLMTILGHVMRLRTLKRNLKSMVELGVTAKLEKDVRLLSMKREVTELVKSRVSHQAVDAEQREGSSDDFQAAPGTSDRGAVNGRYKWDQTTEDRICDLYDHYVEGMDEHKGPQIRKLYLELAELWPEGWMDNHGIKNAVSRAKERQRKQNKLKMGEEKRRRKEAQLNGKKNGDSVIERLTPANSAPTYVPPHLKALPSSKEKLTIKSTSKQRVYEPSRRVGEDNRRLGDEVSYRHVEEIKRLVVEEKRRGLEQRLDDRASKRVDDPGMTRENGSHSSLSKEKQKIRLEDGAKLRRSEDLSSVKRKLPRKSYEGKIIEHSAKKRPKKESSDSYGIESGRSSNYSLLNSPLQKLKRRKLRPPSETKPYPAQKISLSPVTVASKAERYQNSSYPWSNRSSGITGRSGDSDRVREDRPREIREDRVREMSDRPREISDRPREAARWPSEGSRLPKD